ncbi:MAG: hypothetical protein HY077_16925 [Elusimicrobia bacterium]|nr:hypothetical protein [Elusimicrobiota bacterium]
MGTFFWIKASEPPRDPVKEETAAAPPRDPVMEGTAALLQLTWTECPVPMYSNSWANKESRTWWWQGTLDGRMFGVRRITHPKVGDLAFLWVGGLDEITLWLFERTPSGSAEPFEATPYSEGDFTFARRPDFLQALARLSSAVQSVHLLDQAVEARVDWKSASAAGLSSDARILASMRAAMEKARC